MPRRDDTQAFVRIQGRGLRKQERLTQADEKYIREVIQELVEETGVVSQEILQDAAPERSGRLKESIVVTGRNRSTFRPQIRIGVLDLKDDEGFHYLNVTRFGRKAVEASRSRPGSVGGARPARTYNIAPGSPGAQNRPFRGHMLRFTPGDVGTGVLYSRRVKAFHPRRDWVRTAQEEIQQTADYNFDRITKKVELVLNSNNESARRHTSVKVSSRSGKFHS
jgi:hypothetical protein